jgi:hypothetical protein
MLCKISLNLRHTVEEPVLSPVSARFNASGSSTIKKQAYHYQRRELLIFYGLGIALVTSSLVDKISRTPQGPFEDDGVAKTGAW